MLMTLLALIALQRALEDADPPLEDAERFPHVRLCENVAAIGMRRGHYLLFLREIRQWDRDLWLFCEDHERRRRVWFYASAATDPSLNSNLRRCRLRQMLSLMDPEDYLAGRLPPYLFLSDEFP